eukprot:409820_1
MPVEPLARPRRRLRNAIKARGLIVWDLFKSYISKVRTCVVEESGIAAVSFSFLLQFEDADLIEEISVTAENIWDVADGVIRHLLRRLADRIRGNGLTEHNKAIMAKVPANFGRTFPAI